MKTCEGVGKTIYADILEQYMLAAIKKKLKEFNELTADDELGTNPKLNEEKIRLSRLEDEIEQLLNKVGCANETLMKYINEKIEVLDAERAELKKEIYKLSSAANDNNFIVVKNHVDKWSDLTFSDRQAVVDALISIIYITGDQIEITWKI